MPSQPSRLARTRSSYEKTSGSDFNSHRATTRRYANVLRRGRTLAFVHVSVVVPAHNEARFLPNVLNSIAAAAERVTGPVEVIVVANRCTDATATIARTAGPRHR